MEQEAVPAGHKQTKPIWHSPAWLTAMAGIISLSLTAPEIVGNYLAKEQEIKQQMIANKEALQEHEFKIVNNTLAKQDEERVFVLRYLSHTLDDKEARAWAIKEVERLDELTSAQKLLINAQKELQARERELKESKIRGENGVKEAEEQLKKLREVLEDRESEVLELKKKAGIYDDLKGKSSITIFEIRSSMNQKGRVLLETDDFSGSCHFENGTCKIYLAGQAPNRFVIPTKDRISITDKNDKLSYKASNVGGITVIEIKNADIQSGARIIEQIVDYSCETISKDLVCNFIPSNSTRVNWAVTEDIFYKND